MPKFQHVQETLFLDFGCHRGCCQHAALQRKRSQHYEAATFHDRSHTQRKILRGHGWETTTHNSPRREGWRHGFLRSAAGAGQLVFEHMAGSALVGLAPELSQILLGNSQLGQLARVGGIDRMDLGGILDSLLYMVLNATRGNEASDRRFPARSLLGE